MSEIVKNWLGNPKTITWMVGGTLVVIVCVGLIWFWYNGTDIATIYYYIVLVIGGVGVLGFINFFLQLWQTSVQVKTQTRQTELQTQQVRSESLNRCDEKMSNQENASIRITGIQDLEVLAQKNRTDAKFLKQLCDRLQNFINKHAPARDDRKIFENLRETADKDKIIFESVQEQTREEEELKKWEICWQKNQAEVQQAICAFAVIVAMQPEKLRGPDLSYRYLPKLRIPFQEGKQLSFRKAKFTSSFLPRADFAFFPVEDLARRIAAGLSSRMDFRGVKFERANLEHACLSRTELEGAVFDEANLKHARLREANLQGAYLQYANLFDVDLQSTILSDAKFQHSNLTSAKLQGVQEGKYARLTDAILLYANLQGANLAGATLDNIALSDPSMDPDDISFKNADFDGASLKGAVYYKSEGDFFEDIRLDLQGKRLEDRAWDILDFWGHPENRNRGIPVRPEWLKEQGALNTDKAIYSDDPKD